jgi:rubrerythrin
MKAMTDQNLHGALAGESQAHIKYAAFADVARREGKLGVARLFDAVSYAEQVHATGHLRTLGGIGKTEANLAAAFEGETFEIDEMYPAYDAVAKMQGESRAERIIGYALAAEKQHQVYYKAALEAVKAGGDAAGSSVSVCPVCGHTVIDGVPDNCPVCGAKGSTFKTF